MRPKSTPATPPRPISGKKKKIVRRDPEAAELKGHKSPQKAKTSRPHTPPRPTNLQRCLLLGSRAISKKERHLLRDFQNLMPHSLSASKVKIRFGLGKIMHELTTLHRCNTSILFNTRKSETEFWISQSPHGPSALLILHSITTMDELKLTGNALKFSRPLLHFDQEFSTHPHLRVLQTLLTMVFGIPRNHPRSKPFLDHIFCFYFYDERIWFRNYQIIYEKTVQDLMEIGPRFVLYPQMIVDGICGGPVLWKNPISHRTTKTDLLRRKTFSYQMRQAAKEQCERRNREYPPLPDQGLLNGRL